MALAEDKNDIINNTGSDVEECPICYNIIDGALVKTPCNHIFCYNLGLGAPEGIRTHWPVDYKSTALPLRYHCAITVLPLHYRWAITGRHHHGTITTPSRHHHCTITAPSPHHHRRRGSRVGRHLNVPSRSPDQYLRGTPRWISVPRAIWSRKRSATQSKCKA